VIIPVSHKTNVVPFVSIILLQALRGVKYIKKIFFRYWTGELLSTCWTNLVPFVSIILLQALRGVKYILKKFTLGIAEAEDR